MRQPKDELPAGKINGDRPISMNGSKQLFLKNFLKHPRMLGSIIPSSRFLMNRILNRINWDRAQTVVEYGPGIGNFTVEILKRLRPNARLAAIELNPDFVQWLKTNIQDPRLHVAHRSAASVQEVLRSIGCEKVDYVISGLPFSTLPETTRHEIVQATHAALSPEGQLMVYQFSRAVRPSLDRVFDRIEEEFEFFNVLPARLFYCEKQKAAS